MAAPTADTQIRIANRPPPRTLALPPDVSAALLSDESPVKAGEAPEAAQKEAWLNQLVNPNEFYYEHLHPGERAKSPDDEWTPKEHTVFMDSLRAFAPQETHHWGLFSLAIPGRTGRDCFRYYVLLKETGFFEGRPIESALVPDAQFVSPKPKAAPAPQDLASPVARGKSAAPGTPHTPAAQIVQNKETPPLPPSPRRKRKAHNLVELVANQPAKKKRTKRVSFVYHPQTMSTNVAKLTDALRPDLRDQMAARMREMEDLVNVVSPKDAQQAQDHDQRFQRMQLATTFQNERKDLVNKFDLAVQRAEASAAGTPRPFAPAVQFLNWSHRASYAAGAPQEAALRAPVSRQSLDQTLREIRSSFQDAARGLERSQKFRAESLKASQSWQRGELLARLGVQNCVQPNVPEVVVRVVDIA